MAASRLNHCDEGHNVHVERLFAKISQISTIPQAALRTLQITNDPRATATDLADVIRTDPALATRVLRIVNSSLFGLQQEVVTLDHAVVLLGVREIRNLALTTYVATLFRKSHGYGTYSRRDLWLHMVSVAVVARHIAKVCGAVEDDEAYLAGLLHDVGIILLDQTLHRPFCRVVDAISESRTITEVEEEVLGFDHACMGQYALKMWGVPASTAVGAAFHHQPLASPPEHRRLACTVALANSICHRIGIHSLGVATKHSLPQEVFETIGIARSDVTRIVQDLPAELKTAREWATLLGTLES